MRPLTVRPMWSWRAWIVCVALMMSAAAGRASTIGASLGVLFPSDRLSDTADYRGASVLSGPTAGLHLEGELSSALGDIRLGGVAEVAVLRSPEEPALRMYYVPIQAGPMWELSVVEDVSLAASFMAGAAFVSTNMGEERSLGQGVASVAWQVRRSLPDMSVALEMAISLLWGRSLQETLQLRLVLFSE